MGWARFRVPRDRVKAGTDLFTTPSRNTDAARALTGAEIGLAALRMDANSGNSALQRIEAALARIERAATARAPRADADLLRRHEALQAEVSETVAALDALIARGQK